MYAHWRRPCFVLGHAFFGERRRCEAGAISGDLTLSETPFAAIWGQLYENLLTLTIVNTNYPS